MGVDECMERVEGLGAGCDEEQPSHLSRMAAGVLKAIEMCDDETYFARLAQVERRSLAA